MPLSLGPKVFFCSVSAVLSLMIVGCGEPVRTDRTIEFSRDGNQVAFQREEEGVFVADPHGGPATKIFQPDESVIATSRPLTSPTDGRLLFATAERLDEVKPQSTLPASPFPAEGRVVGEIPVRFTCWLRDEPQGDQPVEVRKLFSATCGHIGYVSAGLVIRWHPDGKHVLFIASLEGRAEEHSIFEYDLESEQTRRIFPQAGDAILCDWTPNGSALVCVVGNKKNRNQSSTSSADGIWIGRPDAKDSWWHVPESDQLSSGELPSMIESLRASRPAWTKDDSRFAFVSRVASDRQEASIQHRLHQVEFASRTISTVDESDGSFADLYWSPDGRRLGFLKQPSQAAASIRVLEPTGAISDLAVSSTIRRFAGFDAQARKLAYIAVQPMNRPVESPWWALLLMPDPSSRDSVWIANADLTNPGREVFSGMRVTFPLWSPTEDRLSLWLTFMPHHRSLLSLLRQWGLWPGDPAATINVESGEISWLAVSPQEELQIGHFLLLKRNYAEAWRWYEQARPKLPPVRSPRNWTELTQRLGAPENSQVFEVICLQRLGRDEEAASKLMEFDQHFFPSTDPAPDAQAPDPTDAMFGALGPQVELLKHLIRDLYVAEVFLSVDALDDALMHFRTEPKVPASDDASLSRAIVLAQLLLIAGDDDGYLAHATNVIRPLALRMWQKLADQPEGNKFVLQAATGLCLAPLFRSDFLSRVSDAVLQKNLLLWKEERDRLENGLPVVAVDLVLRAAALKRNEMDEVRAIEARILRDPAARDLFAGQSIEDRLAAWFGLFGQSGQRSLRP
jgi:hypothetical protein